jgi:gliding motility-associated-like protein
VGGTRTSWSSDSNYIANFVAGKYMPILEVKTMLGCTDTLQFKSITVHPKPTAAFSYTPARPVPSSPEIALKNLSNGAEKYEWDFGKYGKSSDKDPLIKIGESGTHEILLVSICERGCRDTIAGTVKVYEDYIIWLPNAFTPNGDNLNELFEPMMQGVEKYEMHIYNRWGEQIYRGANKGWDGMQDGKPVPEGMYVYYIKITTVKYDYVQEKGTLMVLKPE